MDPKENSEHRRMIRTTQDDARENAQISLFDLNPLQGRSNKYIPDATIDIDGQLYEIELKTSDVVKKQVSTARNVTLPKLDEYRKVWWVFSQYQKTEAGFEFTGEHYVLSGGSLEPWFIKQADKISWGTKTYGGLEHWNVCKKLLEKQVSQDTLQRLDNSFHKKGCGLNDPKISWRDVMAYGTKIDKSRPVNHLREIMKKKLDNHSNP